MDHPQANSGAPSSAGETDALTLRLERDLIDALDAYVAAQPAPGPSRAEAAVALLRRALAHFGPAPALPMRKLIKGQYASRRKGEPAPAQETPVAAAIGDFLATAQHAARDMAQTTARAGKKKASTILTEIADAYDGVAPKKARPKRTRTGSEEAEPIKQAQRDD